MDTGWENFKPAPIEVLHSEIMRLFHEFRLRKQKLGKPDGSIPINESIDVIINGHELSAIIAEAKTIVYGKYPDEHKPRPRRRDDG